MTELSGVFTLLPIDDVHYGADSISGLAAALDAYGVSRALLITGNTLATKTNLVDTVCAHAGGKIAGVFHETVQHVHRGSVLRAAEQARGINADAVISFGGGTPNDTGKAVLLALSEGITEPGHFDEFMVKYEYPDKVEIPPMTGTAIPMFAISTTLSAGEFTHFAGITDEVRKVKDLYIDKQLAAKQVFLDPTLTLETPMWLWLSTGMRSVDHCVEALCSSSAHPYTDAMAMHALAGLNENLLACKEDPGNLQARTKAHIAAWMSVCGLANVALGLSHGIGHQLGARNDVPHGHTSCVMMYPTMTFNKDHVADRHGWVAEAMGAKSPDMNATAAGEAGRDAIRELVLKLGLPAKLREVGVEPEDFPAIARDAMQDLVVASNPRPVDSIEDVIDLLQQAY
ncbi:MAG: iron-containing alcohol dehydrogenase [Pseudomonadota bacterium]